MRRARSLLGRAASARRTRTALAAALAGAVALPLAAGPAAATGGGLARPTVPAVALGTNGAPVPELDWGPCTDEMGGAERGFDCATATVPLDYADPQGATIDLALKRHRAGKPAARIGSLFLNPGGPGGSGVDFVSSAPDAYSPAVLARFDIIGFDPRGVARSTPLTCFPSYGAAEEFALSQPAFPLGLREERAVMAAYRGYTASCTQQPDAVLGHMSTGNVARDLDLLRAAVGDRTLTYAGYSYGTQLGSTYANMFPGHVRALVLDAVVDPVAWTTGSSRAEGISEPATTRLRSDAGAYATLQQFFAECADAGPELCLLAEGGDPAGDYARLAADLRRAPVEIPVEEGVVERITYADLVSLTLSVLYQPSAWPLLAALVVVIDELHDAPAAARAKVAARAGAAWQRLQATLRLDDPDAEPAPQVNEGFDGVLCSDSDNPVRQREWQRAGAEADARSPYFGRPWTWAGLACATWPTEDPGRYTGPWDARTANPVLVVGNRYDPATRYESAVELARLLPSSRLLTLDGYGHAALGQSACVDQAVTAYLVKGTLPAAGTVCSPDFGPFDMGGIFSTQQRAAAEGGASSGAAAQEPTARERVIGNLPVAVRAAG